MPKLISDTPKGAYYQRDLENKVRALDLCSYALETANELFDQGDLEPYLTLLSRLHQYNFYNLLLILRQYPSATHLLPFPAWQNIIGDKTTLVLKPEQFKKGIHLVTASTTLYHQDTRSLFWCSILHFDISQTTIRNYEPPKSIYLSGEDHIKTLLRALRSVLRNDYSITISTDLSTNALRGGNAGYLERNVLHCRSDLPNTGALLLLTESLLSITPPATVIGECYQRMFLRMAQHCMLRIWGFEDSRLLYLPKEEEQIISVPTHLRPVFLDLLQRKVRTLEEAVHRRYQIELFEREERGHSQPDLDFRTSEHNEEDTIS